MHGVQEYCNGGSLREAVQRGLFRSGSLRSRFAMLMTILCHVADGIAYMHSKRICHGDLNPSNVLLKVRTDREIPNIQDCFLGLC